MLEKGSGRKGLTLAVCNVGSLNPQHRKDCEEARKYVPPREKYTDKDGVVHDPDFRLPKYNPENYTQSGLYVLDFNEKYKKSSAFRAVMQRQVDGD